jgi:hypothetical protein
MMKTVTFKFFIGDQVWYRAMNRIGEVISCSFDRNYGYRYIVRIAYRAQWRDEECIEGMLTLASEHIAGLLDRGISPGNSPDGSLSEATDARTGQ